MEKAPLKTLKQEIKELNADLVARIVLFEEKTGLKVEKVTKDQAVYVTDFKVSIKNPFDE